MRADGTNPAPVERTTSNPHGLDCPFCAYDFSGFPGGDPPVCPECGKDPAAERRAVARWHRGARRWIWGAVVVIAGCAIATVLGGCGGAITPALLAEAVVGGLGVAIAVGWSLASLEENARPSVGIFSGGAARATVPIALFPVIAVTIWSWYVPLAVSSHGHGQFDVASDTCMRLTKAALLACGLAWGFAVIATLCRTRSVSQFARVAFGLAIVTTGALVLSLLAAAIAVQASVGGDGRGP